MWLPGHSTLRIPSRKHTRRSAEDAKPSWTMWRTISRKILQMCLSQRETMAKRMFKVLQNVWYGIWGKPNVLCMFNTDFSVGKCFAEAILYSIPIYFGQSTLFYCDSVALFSNPLLLPLLPTIAHHCTHIYSYSITAVTLMVLRLLSCCCSPYILYSMIIL